MQFAIILQYKQKLFYLFYMNFYVRYFQQFGIVISIIYSLNGEVKDVKNLQYDSKMQTRV